MRTLSLLSVLLFIACNGQPDPGTGEFVGPAPRSPESPSAASTDAGPDAPGGALIGGRVETDLGEPIIGRPIALVDARGARREILSDEGGTFYFTDVARPYDLVVAGAPSGDVRNPTIFLGLTRTDPFIELFERDGPGRLPPAQTLRFAVKPPRCNGPSCFLSIASGSVSGGGANAIAYRDEERIEFQIDHAWKCLPSAKDIITLHVLAYDATRSTFAHVVRDGIRAEAGETTELGFLEPLPVPASAPLVVSAIARGPTAAWTPSIGTWLDLPGNTSMSFTYEASSRGETLALPLLPGATFRANAWMQHPPVADRPMFHSAVQAWSGARPIVQGGGALPMDLPSPPVMIRPEMDGTLSARGLGLAWTNPKSAPTPLTEITIAREDSGVLRYRIWTIGDEVSFARLALLGLQPLSPGDHWIGITTWPADALDDFVHPDASMRHARSDPRRGGAATYERFRFQVTP